MTEHKAAKPDGHTSVPLTLAESQLGLPRGSFPFESRFADCRGAQVHYVDEGTGPTLFMLHGNPTWSFLYRKLIVGLRDRFRCVALDLPGFGLSAAPAGYRYLPGEHRDVVCEFLGRLSIRDATLVAHDWGGPIGLSAALAEPGRFSRFVLGNTWAWPVNGVFHFEWFSRLMGGPFGRWGARRWNLFVNGVMPAAMRRGPLPADVLNAYRAPFVRSADVTGTHVFPRAITGSRQFLRSLADGLDEFDADSVLFLWPDKDIAFRSAELEHWRHIFPAASVVHVQQCGHYVWEEAADEAVTAIGRWLGATSSRAQVRQPPARDRAATP